MYWGHWVEKREIYMIVKKFYIVEFFFEGSDFYPILGVFYLNSYVVVIISIPCFYFSVKLIFVEVRS